MTNKKQSIKQKIPPEDRRDFFVWEKVHAAAKDVRYVNFRRRRRENADPKVGKKIETQSNFRLIRIVVCCR